MDNSIADKIRILRESKRLTLDQVAKKLKTTRQTLFKYENGIVTNIPSDKISELAEIYGVSPAYLMGWDNIPNRGSNNTNTDANIKNNRGLYKAETTMSLISDHPSSAVTFTFTTANEEGLVPYTVSDNAFAPRIQQGDSVFVSALNQNEVLVPYKTVLAIHTVDSKGSKFNPFTVLRLFYYTPDRLGIITYAPGTFNNQIPPVYYPFSSINTDTPLIGVARSISFNIL